MRKLVLLVAALALLTLAVVPSLAQGGNTIADIAAGNPDFSTLVTALDAAGLVETLAGDGTFTVFAPTNDAFDALPLGTLDMLLADIPTLTEVLTYHVLPGSVIEDGFVFLQNRATVQGAPLSVSRKDGAFFVNDTVKIVTTDIGASNGVIHVVDAVMLPPESDLAARVTAYSQVKVRVAHFSPDTPAVDVYVNGQLSDVRGLEFPALTEWFTLPGGVYNIAVAPAGTSLDQAAIGPADLELPGGKWLTVAAVGSLADGTLGPAIIDEDYSPVAANTARVTVFHAIEDAPAVDVRAGGEAVIRVLDFPGRRDNDGASTIEVPSGVYNLDVVPFGRGAPVVLDLPNTFLQGGAHYFVAAVGTLDEPQAVVAVTDPATGGAPALRPLGSLIASIGDLSTLSGLGGSAFFSGSAAMLNQRGPFTVFAPTNAAFDQLRQAIGLAAFNQIADNPGSTPTRYIILYHVTADKYMAADVVGASEIMAATGDPITITVRDGRVFLNDTIEVIATDIPASNGVLHIISGVLVPPDEQ